MSGDQQQWINFYFSTSNVVMWAEEVASEREIPIEVIPTRARKEATCGLAIRTSPDWRERLESVFEEEGISFEVEV
jgi:hypothetical protein